MHSWDNWRGVTLHETPLQDGEAAARLLSYYAVPKEHPLFKNFVAAMRNEDTLRSYPEFFGQWVIVTVQPYKKTTTNAPAKK